MFPGLNALAPVAGALVAISFLPSPKWIAVFLDLASGFFLYTATSDLLPEAFRRSPDLAVALVPVVGVLIVALAIGVANLQHGSA